MNGGRQAARGVNLVSVDHFAQELKRQLKTAAEQGATTVVITSEDLCKLIRGWKPLDAGLLRCHAGGGKARRCRARFAECRLWHDGTLSNAALKSVPGPKGR
jgi:hypothetical protein